MSGQDRSDTSDPGIGVVTDCQRDPNGWVYPILDTVTTEPGRSNTEPVVIDQLQAPLSQFLKTRPDDLGDGNSAFVPRNARPITEVGKTEPSHFH